MGSEPSKQKIAAPPTVDEMAIELKMNSKMLQREAKKAEKDSKNNIKKAEMCLKKGDEAGARVFCLTAQQSKSSSEKYLKTSAQLESLSATIKQNTKVQEVMARTMNIMPGIMQNQANMDVGALHQNIEKFNEAMDTVKVNNAITNQAYERMEDNGVEESANKLFDQLKADVIYKNMQEGGNIAEIPIKEKAETNHDNLNDFINDLKK